jgi:hypothetical protein
MSDAGSPDAGGREFNVVARPIPGTGGPENPPRTGFFRNLSQQMVRPEVRGKVAQILDQHEKARYFRTAGMGAAVRHTLGLPQTPSHLNDYFRAQMNKSNQAGSSQDPDSMIGVREPYEPGHWTPGGESQSYRVQDDMRYRWQRMTSQGTPPGEA